MIINKTKSNHSLKKYRILFFALTLSIFLSGVSSAQVLSQAPDQNSSYVADLADPAYITESLAEDFILTSSITIGQIRIWGGYSPDAITPALDKFSVIFHSNSSGLPSIVLSTENNVPVVRTATGNTISGTMTEYVYTLTLANPVVLAPGTYWVEIFNDTRGNPYGFAWETGNLDAINGFLGIAYSLSAPGSTWGNDSHNLAIEILQEEKPVAVPVVNGFGMMIFIVLAGLGAVYYLRRHRRIQN